MNLLIDGCIFGSTDEAELGLFWKQIIPRLPKLLEGDTVFYMNRGVHADPFPLENTGFSVLNAPIPELVQFNIEHRRLLALCDELKIDVFLTSRYTHAPAGRAKVIFTLAAAFPYLSQIDFPSLIAREHLIGTADLCIAMDQDAANYLLWGYGVPISKTQVVGTNPIDFDKIAANVAGAIRQLASTSALR